MHAPVGAQLASIWEKPSILQMKFKCLITIAKDNHCRPGYIYSFCGNKDRNSSDSLKILGKVRKYMRAPVGAQLASIWEKPRILQLKFKCLITIIRLL